MNTISGYNIKKIVDNIDILEGLEEFIFDKLKSHEDFLSYNDGVLIDTREILPNIINSRKFTYPSSIYGQRHGSNQSVSWNVRKHVPDDNYITDSQGILKNNHNDCDTNQRILNAKKRIPIILMFGGSTMMSCGGISPIFSIPSLVEGILKKKYSKDVVCINYGLGGTCSREALDLYIHEASELTDSANVIFYDGWNCASYLTQTHMIRSSNFTFNNLASSGDTFRTIENNVFLSKAYDLSWHLRRSLNLLVANIFSILIKILPEKFKTLFSIIQNKLFSLSPNNIIYEFISKLDTSDETIKSSVDKAVSQYINIHKSVNSICESNNSNFIWIQQPLTFWGNKPLTDNELIWKNSGDSSGNPKIFMEFEKKFNLKFKKDLNNKLKNSFYDLTRTFDNIEQELYIDSGHLNQLGNLIISAKIAEIIYNDNYILK